jgi:hypothetical protein
MKEFPGAWPPGPPGKETEKRRREREGGAGTEEKKVMEKEG